MAMGALMVGTDPTALYDIPNPTAIKFGYNDISSSDAGRTNDANVTMHKNLITSKRTIALSWKNLSGERASVVLQAFKPEYVWVKYLEPEDNAYAVRQFYTGNRSVDVGTYFPTSTFQIGGVTYSQVSFNIIEV
jgi:hypothetical protein